MNKNVWILNHYATDTFFNRGGRHYWFAKNLINDGYNATVFCANTVHNSDKVINIDKDYCYKQDTVDNIPYVFVGTTTYKGNGMSRIKNMYNFYHNMLTIADLNKNNGNKPDIIYASSVHPLTLLAGIKMAKRFNIPCICEVRDLWPETLVQFGKIKKNGLLAKVLYKLEHWLYKNADSLIFTMAGGKDYITDRKWEDVDLNKVHHINNGIDLDKCIYSRDNIIYKNDDLEAEGYFNVIYTGSIGAANKVKDIIQALEILHNKGYNKIRLFLFGNGLEKKSLEDYCKEHKVANIYFMGKVEKKYIPNILGHSQLNIFTGKSIDLYKYGISLNKLFDYFASGKPLLSNYTVGYDLLDKYKCGKTVIGDANKLAEGILEFYNMPKEEYDKYCKNSLAAAKAYDFKNLTHQLESIIEEELKNKKASNI